MNYAVQTGPGASKENRSCGLGSIFPGRAGGRFRLKKLVIFLWVLVMAAVAAVVLSFTIGTSRSSQSLRAARLRVFFGGWIWRCCPCRLQVHRKSLSVLDGDVFHEASV